MKFDQSKDELTTVNRGYFDHWGNFDQYAFSWLYHFLFIFASVFDKYFVFIWFPWRLRVIQNKLWTKVMKSWLLCDVTRYTILAIFSFFENTAFVSCEMEISH